MKKIFYCLLAGMLLVGPMSCKKDDPAGPTLSNTPEANAEDDNKSGGIYKGALVGSTGTIKIVLQGGKKEIALKFDGVTRTLTTTALDSWTSGQGITNAVFTSGDWSVNLSLLPDGSGGSVEFSIPGHTNIQVALQKERSTQLIMAFEGTFAGSETGVWNFVVQANTIFGVTKTSSNTTDSFFGTITGTTVAVTFSSGSTVTAAGTLTGNTATGTWTDSADSSGTWTGTRTM